jgi:polyisoprenyl-phosphate glycosyltransferase
MSKKIVCLSIPCYNEKDNVVPMAEAVIQMFETELTQYDYIVQFIDNCSTDGTTQLLRELCRKNNKVRAILNARNFPKTSGYYGIMQSQGDCTIALPCDFQVPLNLIPQMLDKWENGSKIVCLMKTSSKENKLMWRVRKLFYYLSNRFSDTEILRGFTGSGLYDARFLDICRAIDDPVVSFTQMIVTLGYDIGYIYFQEQMRNAGKSKHSIFSLIDLAITRFINSSSVAPRYATLIGFFLAIISFLIGIVYLILKLIFWNQFPAGMVPVLLGVFFLGSIQLFFIGLIGEYVIIVNTRLMKRPLVVERERLNFSSNESESESDLSIHPAKERIGND